MPQTNSENLSTDEKLMAIGPKSATVILLYYFFLFLAFSYLSYTTLISHDSGNQHSPLVFSVFLSVVGSTIFYSRKLYKACISESYNSRDGTTLQKIGTFAFFILRPSFAAAFAFIINIIWNSTIITSVDGFTSFSKSHFYVSGAIGFFAGFLAGRILTKMEFVGEKHLGGVW